MASDGRTGLRVARDFDQQVRPLVLAQDDVELGETTPTLGREAFNNHEVLILAARNQATRRVALCGTLLGRGHILAELAKEALPEILAEPVEREWGTESPLRSRWRLLGGEHMLAGDVEWRCRGV